jgi:hypothetical protein
MLNRPCLEPGCPRLQPATRCAEHTRAKDRQRGTRQQRGYDAQHDQLRAHLVAAYHPADPCPRCRQPLGPDPSALDLMHNDQRTGWLGLGHQHCNRATAKTAAAFS